MNRSVFRILSLMLAVPFLFSGCAAALIAGGVGVGAGTVAFIKGQLESTEMVTLDRAWAATQQTMEELEFDVEEKKKDALNAKLIAKDSNRRRIEIRLERKDENKTTIKIRIGVFGDEEDSRMILREIRANL